MIFETKPTKFAIRLAFISAILLFVNTQVFAQKNNNIRIKKLIALSEQNQELSPRKSLFYAKKAEELVFETEEKKLSANVLYQISYAYFNLGNMDSCIIYSNNILALTDIDLKTKGKVYSYLSTAYRRKGNYKDAIRYARLSIRYYTETKDKKGLAQATYNLGKIYHVSGNNKKAVEHYFDVLKYYRLQNDTIKQGQILGSISNVYMETGEKEKGKEYNMKAIRILKQYPNNGLYADALNNYGIVFYEQQNFDSAQYYFEQALNVYKKIDKKDAVAAAGQNLGITYVYLNKTKKGFNYLNQSLKIFRDLNLEDQISVMTDLGDAYNYINKIDSAKFYLSEAYKLADKKNNTYYKKETLRLLFKLYDRNRDYKNALNFYKKYINYKDSIDNEKMKKSLSEIEIKYQTAQKEKEILQLKGKEMLDKANKRLFIIGIISLIIIFTLIIIRIQTKRRKDSELQRQKIIVHQKEKELAETKLIQKETEEKRLKDEIEFKTKQLAGHALNMMQKNKLLQELSEHISKKAQGMEEKVKKELISVRRQIETGLKVDKDWDLFKFYFEQINESFFDKLKDINPKLTGNDFKLCALTKLNMSLKETASVLNISPNSVKNARYRLKKKLNLNSETDINQFINNL